MTMKLGLVLAGGGGKGAYQVGVWQALAEAGLAQKIDVVAGTSIGGLHAALFLQDGLDLARKMWLSLTPSQSLGADRPVTAADLEKLAERITQGGGGIPSRGLFSRRSLEQMLDATLNPGAWRPGRMGFATCLPIDPPGPPVYFPLHGTSKERCRRTLLATTALPYIFDPVEIDGVLYVDGGATGGDNLPVRPVYEQGCDLIFVIHLKQDGPIDPALFPGARLVQLIPSESLGGFADGTMDFDGTHAAWRMELGYKDMKACLATLDLSSQAARRQNSESEPSDRQAGDIRARGN